MKFSIDKEVFLENLNIIYRGLPAKSSMPILTGIKLEVTENDIFLTSSNMDISIETIISDPSLEIIEKGKTVIPGKFLLEIIRKINSKKITFTLIENKILLIEVERGEYKLHLMDVMDYPNINFVVLENPLTIHSNILKSIIKETVFATSSSEKKPILTGVNFDLSDNILKCVATDSYRLSQKKLNLDINYPNLNITIPNKSLEELYKIIDNLNDNLDIYFSSNKVLFKFKNVIFQTRLLEGSYPNTTNLIPTNFTNSITFNKDDLIEALERVSLLSPRDKEKEKEITYSIIKLSINKKNKIEISTNNNQVGDAKEELIALNFSCDENLNIGFSSRYLLEALRAFTSNKIVINLIGEIRPFVIKNVENDDLIQLILPVRMN